MFRTWLKTILYTVLSVLMIVSSATAAPLSSRGAAQTPAPGHLGEPGLSYSFNRVWGETDSPYLVDTVHLNRPIGIYIDPASGAFFLTEALGKRLLKYNADKSLAWSIGKVGVSRTEKYMFSDPRAVNLAPDGHIWVGDYSRLAEYTSDGVFLSNFPAVEPWRTGVDNDRFNEIESIAFDGLGHLFVADRWNNRVQVYDWTAGAAPIYRTSLANLGALGNLKEPVSVVARANGKLFIADAGNRRVLACPYNGAWECTEIFGNLGLVRGLALGPDGALYIADNDVHQGKIWRIEIGGAPYPLVSNAWATNLALDSAGNLYGADEWGCAMWKYSSQTTNHEAFLGVPYVGYLTDTAHFNQPRVETDAQGNRYVLEEAGDRLLKFGPDGAFLWSFGEPGRDIDDNSHLSWPRGMDVAPDGTIFIASGSQVVMLRSDGAFLGKITSAMASPALGWVADVAVDAARGLIYICDNLHERIVVFVKGPDGYVQDTAHQIGVTDENGSDNAHLWGPVGLGIDSSGNVYVGDWDNARVQKFSAYPNLQYQMTLGTPSSAGSQINQISGPGDIEVDGAGHIYVAETGNSRVSVYDSTGAYLATIGGRWGAGNGDFLTVSDASVDSDGNVYVSDSDAMRIQVFTPGYPGWLQRNINGFGSASNTQVNALAVYNDALYAGTCNWSTGGEIWRTTNGKSWEQVPQAGAIFGPDAPCITNMLAFNGKLYATIAWGASGSKHRLWRYDGAGWEKVLERGSNGLVGMAAFNGRLYVSEVQPADGPGLMMWTSATGDISGWTPIVTAGKGNPHNYAASSFSVFNGRFYACVGNALDGMEIWRLSADETAFDRLITAGNGNPNNVSPGGFAVYNGVFYLGSRSSDNHAMLMRSTDGEHWTVVTDNGFGNPNNRKVEGMTSIAGQLFAFIQNEPEGLQVWRAATPDGLTWKPYSLQGFGDPTNSNVVLNSAEAVFQGALYRGTTNSTKGAQVVMLLPYRAYMPILGK